MLHRHVVVVSLVLGATCSFCLADDSTPDITADALIEHVRKLTDKALLGRRAGTPFERRTVEYLRHQFDEMGIEPVVLGKRVQAFRLSSRDDGALSFNVSGVIRSPEHKRNGQEGVVVLGAHLDHLGPTDDGGFHPGADDNASGVAVVLEVARQLKRQSQLLKRSVVVAFFGAEEIGLVGSQRFVESGPVDRTKIVAMVNIDMIGRPLMDQSKLETMKRLVRVNSNDSIGIVGTQSRPRFDVLVKRACRRSGVTVYGTQPLLAPLIQQLAGNRSDHAAFERVGIPTLFLSSGISDDYHRPSDTIDKLKPQLMAQRARMVFDLIMELSITPIDQLPVRENAMVPLGQLVKDLELRVGKLVVRLQDNSLSPQSLSGLQSLVHADSPSFDAFDPDSSGSSAGLNFEHIISGHAHPANRFTPRQGKYDLYELADVANSATLVRMREDSPWDVSSTLNYTIKAPHYVDFEFRCTPRSDSAFGQRNYAICFFANYMNDVDDPAIHFLGVRSSHQKEAWVVADAPNEHVDWNRGGTYRHVNAKEIEYDTDHDFRLNSWSYPYPRYTKPFYYGRAANGMVFMLMFDRAYTAEDEIRFSVFKFKLPEKTRPAWDFQYVIHKAVEGNQYGFRGRLVWKPWISPDDCVAEYESWRRSQ